MTTIFDFISQKNRHSKKIVLGKIAKFIATTKK